MNNYGNYGNRRYTNGNGGHNNQPSRMANDCGCKPEKPVYDCGCKPANDCGCKPEKPVYDCGCQESTEKGATDCGCVIGTKNGYSDCCEKDMPGMMVAMAYVPWQQWENLYEVCEGYSKGTIFKQLDLDFLGRRCN